MTSQLKIDINGASQAYPFFNEWMSNAMSGINNLFISTHSNECTNFKKSLQYTLNRHVRGRTFGSKLNTQYFMMYSSHFAMGSEKLDKNGCEPKKAQVIDISKYLKTDLYQNIKEKISAYCNIESDGDIEAPSEKTIQDAIFFVDNILKKQGVNLGRVRPVDDGEINFFWNTKDFTLDVALYGDDKYYYYFEDKFKKTKFSAEKFLEQPLDDDALAMIKSKW